MAELQIRYLEDLVLRNKAGGVHENTLLAKYYIDSRRSRSHAVSHATPSFGGGHGHGPEGERGKRQTLFQLLEGNYTFDFQKLDEMIRGLDIPEAKIILCAKLGKHYQALETIYTHWGADRITLCEAYCQCFGDVAKLDQLNRESPHKRLFTHYAYWTAKAAEWPLSDPTTYALDRDSETSIDKLLMILLKIVVAHADGTDDSATAAKHLMSKYIHFCGHNSTLNGVSILEVIPPTWNFNKFADFFNHLQLRLLHEQRTKAVKRGLARSLHAKTAKSLHKLTTLPPVVVDSTTLCTACSEPIKIGSGIAIKVPAQKHGQEPGAPARQPIVVHEYCVRKGHMG